MGVRTDRLEGGIIFSCVAYETFGIVVNEVSGKKLVPLITDILGPLTHHKYYRIITWMFLGYWWNHFYQKGCEAHRCPNCELSLDT